MNNGNGNGNGNGNDNGNDYGYESHNETGYLTPRFEDYEANRKIVIRNRICMTVILVLVCVFIYFAVEYYI